MTLRFRHILFLLPFCVAIANPNEVTSALSKPDDPPINPNANSVLDVKAAPKPDFTQSLILQALGLIGVTYRWGGNSPETGLDCSGFIRYVFQQSLNIALPHNAFAISRLGEDVERDELKPGDLVFFNTLGRRFSHVGIYLGDDRFIHSPSRGSKIQVVSLKEAYWQKHYNGAKRVTHDSVAEREPKLAQLMAEAREASSSKSKKKGKHGKTSKSGKSGKSGKHSHHTGTGKKSSHGKHKSKH
ncbi:C40 family peptidase [Chitinimonas sp.]|uniref:C40 family peptidase n=1 Tax=Chitinimonas sp. TaxID=1934313 RepID=UPI0035B29AA8